MSSDITQSQPLMIRIIRMWMVNDVDKIHNDYINEHGILDCDGTEFLLWDAVLNLPQDYIFGKKTIPAWRIQRLKEVAEMLDEWVIYSVTDVWEVTPLEVWKTKFAEFLQVTALSPQEKKETT